MAVKVSIPTPLRPQANDQATVMVEAANVAEALKKLIEIHPAMGSKLFENGNLRRFVNIFVNDEDVRYLDQLDTAIKDGDEVAIIPAVAGG